MQTKIYYFSGTGNTFALAKAIAEKIGAELIAIPKLMIERKIRIEADVKCDAKLLLQASLNEIRR